MFIIIIIMKGIGTKRIETKRLLLRKMTPEDARHMYEGWTSDALVARFTSWDKHESIEITEQYVKYKVARYDLNNYCFDWIVSLKKTGEIIGEIEAVDLSIQDRLVIVGYCYGSKYWNKGYATEALKAFINYMFNRVDADKVLACHVSLNPASGKVMKKAGMNLDGVLRGHKVDKYTKERCDLLWYSIDNPNREVNNG